MHSKNSFFSKVGTAESSKSDSRPYYWYHPLLLFKPNHLSLLTLPTTVGIKRFCKHEQY